VTRHFYCTNGYANALQCHITVHFLPCSELQLYQTKFINKIYFNNDFTNYSLRKNILFASSFTAYTWFPSHANWVIKQSNNVCWNDTVKLPLNWLNTNCGLSVLCDLLTGSARFPVLSGVVHNTTTVKESLHTCTLMSTKIHRPEIF